ncbi:uncharacterized protein LOC101746858 [Bombyx mori]|uniref:Uncharacterized protein n=1 Tax=Bombyx mori TaxID=7091 RepID=A0A8R2ANU9_BOMMO|nr:uncharacterized protein LOC101746858 [Bombyx mori]
MMSVSFTSKASYGGCRYDKTQKCCRLPRKIIASKQISKDASTKSKTCSESAVSTKSVIKPKKTAKSDSNFASNKCPTMPISICEKCGDSINPNSSSEENNKHNILYTLKSNRKYYQDEKISSIEQFYKNTNFEQSATSIRDERNHNKNYLGTISETPEFCITSNRDLEDSMVKFYSNDDKIFLDTDKPEIIEELKEFRNNNYFECHSSKSRIKNRGSATSLKDHECVYRFYLNERLYPEPLNADYKNTIRCVQCHLPMESRSDSKEKINGTLQAKVSLGGELNDVMLLLPAKEPLIIKERRREEKKPTEPIYFGVIKFGFGRNSNMKSAYESNSLALKYQKGYQEFAAKTCCRYKNIDDNDVLVL